MAVDYTEADFEKISKKVQKEKLFNRAEFTRQIPNPTRDAILENLAKTRILTYLERSPTAYFPHGVAEFYARAVILEDGGIASQVMGKKLKVTADTLGKMFELPLDGADVNCYRAGEEHAAWEQWKLSDCQEKFTICTQRKNLKVEYAYLLDIAVRMICGAIGSQGNLTSERYRVMMALRDGAQINWADYIFSRLQSHIAQNGSVAESKDLNANVSFGIKISVIIEELVKVKPDFAIAKPLIKTDFIPHQTNSNLNKGTKKSAGRKDIEKEPKLKRRRRPCSDSVEEMQLIDEFVEEDKGDAAAAPPLVSEQAADIIDEMRRRISDLEALVKKMTPSDGSCVRPFTTDLATQLHSNTFDVLQMKHTLSSRFGCDSAAAPPPFNNNNKKKKDVKYVAMSEEDFLRLGRYYNDHVRWKALKKKEKIAGSMTKRLLKIAHEAEKERKGKEKMSAEELDEEERKANGALKEIVSREDNNIIEEEECEEFVENEVANKDSGDDGATHNVVCI